MGKYRLLEREGQGGMAEVYRAFQPGLDRVVAVKILRPDLSDPREFLERFKREARAVAALRHPNVVQVFDFDVDSDTHYMVMEFVDGASLKERLDALAQKGERMPLADVLQTFRGLCAAVDYAHTCGMIHCDIKPANIMIEPGGRPCADRTWPDGRRARRLPHLPRPRPRRKLTRARAGRAGCDGTMTRKATRAPLVTHFTPPSRFTPTSR